MDSLAISILPLDDQEETFALFKLSASGHFFVGVQKRRASNVLSVLFRVLGMSGLDLQGCLGRVRRAAFRFEQYVAVLVRN